MDRRSFVATTAAGVTGVALGRFVGAQPAALARPARRRYDRVVTGWMPGGFKVPAGQVWKIKGLVRTDGNVVVEGTLVMRRGSTLRFVKVKEQLFRGGGMDPMPTDVGLWVMGRGLLDAQGTPKTAWTHRPSSPRGWRRRDDLFITPTRAGDFECRRWRRGDAVPRAYHDVPRAEVLNLTRDVKIQGTREGRAHVFIRSSRRQIIRFVEFRYMGPQKNGDGVLGRWGLHFHHCLNGSRGSLVEGCVVRDGGARAFVPHMSHGITFKNCISFRVALSAFWWDTNDKTHGTLFYRCVAAETLKAASEQHQVTGFRAQEGRRNRMIGCVAVGTHGGSNSSGFDWPGKSKSVWRFVDCVAHNNKQHGIFWWQNGIKDPGHKTRRFVSYNNNKSAVFQGAYLNPVRHFDLRARGNHIEIHSASQRAGRAQAGWHRVDVNVARKRDYSAEIRASNVSSSTPTQFVACSLRGYRKKPILIMSNSHFRRLDFIACTRDDGRDLEPSDFVWESKEKKGKGGGSGKDDRPGSGDKDDGAGRIDGDILGGSGQDRQDKKDRDSGRQKGKDDDGGNSDFVVRVQRRNGSAYAFNQSGRVRRIGRFH